MCGIAGFFNFDGRPADRNVLDRMIGAIGHRGPDDTGAHVQGPLALAHNRLSIIDIGGGHQPMGSANGSLWIVFNGEIFNFIELREELTRKGHRFSSRSDTEVILHLYQEYGPACVQRLNGQWAFAIWDGLQRQLFLSRDRVGVRPLFYMSDANTFAFASEIKALFSRPGVERKLDPQALDHIFTFWVALAPRTVFKDVFELPPGHSIIVKDGEAKVFEYWRLNYGRMEMAESPTEADDRQKEDQFRDLLLDATRLRLRADVPVGAYLSGGLDSSIIAALAQRFAGESLQTFSVAFEDPLLDESVYQREVAEGLGTKHQTIRCSASDISEVFPDVIWHVERPILRTAPAPLFLLAKLVSENGLKVVLTGEGADEFFGGYDIYKETKIRAFWAAHMDSRRGPLLLKRLYPYLPDLQKQPSVYLQAFFRVSGKDDVADPFFSHRPRWQLTARSKNFFSQEMQELQSHDCQRDIEELMPEGFAGWTPFCRAQYLESALLLPGYLLSSQADRVSMAHAVEGRYPFLDHRVVEFSSGLPNRLKMKVLNEKYILKKVFGDLVPVSVRTRPKQPYRAPDAVSFFDPATRKARHEYVEDLLSPQVIRNSGIFDPLAVQKLTEKARDGRISGFLENAALVGILSTQMLVDQYILNFEKRLIHAAHRAGSTSVCSR